MKKITDLTSLEDTQLDKEIKEILGKDFPLPDKVEAGKAAAFDQIRARQNKQDMANMIGKQMKKKKEKKKYIWKSIAGMGAAAAAFCGVCIVNPAFAQQIPLVGHVFEEIGKSMGFSGDFHEFAKPVADGSDETEAVDKEEIKETSAQDDGAQNGGQSAAEDTSDNTNEDTAYSQTRNGMTLTLSEVYCNDVALYASFVIKTEDKFPETDTWQEGETPIIQLMNANAKFDYVSQKCHLGIGALDGRMIDDHTYAGVLRYDIENSKTVTDYEGYNEKLYEFLETLGVTEKDVEDDYDAAVKKIGEQLGIQGDEWPTEEELQAAGGPAMEDFKDSVEEIPDSFHMELHIPKVVGSKVDADYPEMPEDIRASYEQAMAENGLSTKDEDYQSFTEEQKEIEHQLFTKMYNEYYERYPDAQMMSCNKYEHWWVDGPWDFSFDVEKNDKSTIVKEINDVDENGLGLISVTKTPFEIVVDDGMNYDYFTTVLDADGEPMDTGKFGGSVNTLAIGDRDVSKIDVYICDYVEYMDELKGYYWSEDYEEKKKTKTYKQLLDERALYHKEIVFDE